MVDMNNDSSPPLCGTELVTFQKVYAQNIHGYASLLICVIGSMANLMNIVVLTRKDMISPTNVVLTGLAIADLAVLLEYIPYTLHTYLRPTSHSVKDRYTYGWAMLVLWHSNFSQVFHTISIWLTVVLAVWRYIAVAYPQKNRDWCNMDTTYLAVVAGYILCPLLCIPVFLSFNVTPVVELLDDNGFQTKNHTIGTNTTVFVVTMSEIVKQNFIKDLNFLIYSVLFKLTPSVALTVLSLRLVCALLETKKRRQKLTSSLNRKNAKNAEKEKQTDRTTRMLLAVLLLFLVTEVPQGILGLLTVIFGEKFFKDCYQKLGEVADILALINSAINFALYYVMSRQFRTTFKALLSYNTFPARKHTPFNDINNHTTTQITQV